MLTNLSFIHNQIKQINSKERMREVEKERDNQKSNSNNNTSSQTGLLFFRHLNSK
jgi:hypothetical protein